MSDLRLLRQQPLGDGIRPILYDRHGPGWSVDHIDLIVATEVLNGQHLHGRAKRMETDFKKAAEAIDSGKELFRRSLESMVLQEQAAAEAAKRASTSIRKSANEVAEGLQRLEKSADFRRLEAYVSVLERAATALTALADLDREGRLARVMEAVK